MLFEDILIILAICLFVAAVGIELRRNRGKRMYVGREAKTREPGQSSQSVNQVPTVAPQGTPPVVTQEEFKRPTKSA
jgi:hypothetical protein